MASLQALPAGEDNFAFIDRLLDTLEAEREPLASSKPESLQEPASPAVNSPWDASELFEAVDAHPPAAAPLVPLEAGGSSDVRKPCGASLHGESMSSLLNRFCKDGDESIVDDLLDHFLGSASDAGSLIEAIGEGMLIPKQPRPLAKFPVAKTCLHAPMRINLHEAERLRRQEFESPCLKTWDALLSSARDILQSARAPQSPCSGSEARPPLSSRRPADGGGSSRRPSREAASPCWQEAGGALAGSGVGAPCLEASCAGEAEPANLSRDLISVDAKRDLLARLAELDDQEALRSFMRHFLMGVRHRLLTNLPGGGEFEEEGDSAAVARTKSGSTEDFDDDSSVWSCRSVNTVTVEE